MYYGVNVERELKFYEDHPGLYEFAELEAMYLFLKDPTNKPLWVNQRLKREARKYERKGIPKERWPKTLQGIDIEEIPCKMASENSEVTTDDPVPLQMQEDSPQEEQPLQPKVRNEGDPFQSDSFGSVLGEEDRSGYALGNRKVR